MYEEIIEHLKGQLPKERLQKIKMHNLHLGVFIEPYLTYMLDGKKKIESRFSKNKILPYNQISKEDIVIVKKSSGDVLAYFTIKELLFLDLSKISIDEIKFKYNKLLCVDESFWETKKNSNYATLIFIDEVQKLEPFHIDKKGMQSWIKLERSV